MLWLCLLFYIWFSRFYHFNFDTCGVCVSLSADPLIFVFIVVVVLMCNKWVVKIAPILVEKPNRIISVTGLVVRGFVLILFVSCLTCAITANYYYRITASRHTHSHTLPSIATKPSTTTRTPVDTKLWNSELTVGVRQGEQNAKKVRDFVR